MNPKSLKQKARCKQILKVTVQAQSCGPMVLEISYLEQGKTRMSLLRDSTNRVQHFANLGQIYQLCRKAGIHQAELCQTIAHAEAMACTDNSSLKACIPLQF